MPRSRPLFNLLAVGGMLAGMSIGMTGCVLDDIGSMVESLSPPSPGEAARLMFDPHDPDNRRRGTVLLSNSPFGGVDVYVAAYRDMVQNDPDPIVRSAAIRALARHGEPTDAVDIAVHLADESKQVRWEAAKGLQRLHYPDVVPLLLAVVRSQTEDPDVREAAVTAMGQYKEDRVVQALISSLRARELPVNLAAARSLRTLTGQDHELDADAWYAWYEQASADGRPFNEAVVYQYPVYYREETWLDKISIFSHNVYEAPDRPAGLREDDRRRTYDDDDTAEEAVSSDG